MAGTPTTPELATMPIIPARQLRSVIWSIITRGIDGAERSIKSLHPSVRCGGYVGLHSLSVKPDSVKNVIDALRTKLLAIIMKKGLLPVETRGLEGVYILLITYFAAHANSLEEVCITTGCPMLYRATLTNGAWNMSEESSEDPSQKYLFPNVLED
ncbi:hypothetical protein FOXYSP1_13376 [Fusarium oxysporum f. sp. phaseoli]